MADRQGAESLFFFLGGGGSSLIRVQGLGHRVPLKGSIRDL